MRRHNAIASDQKDEIDVLFSNIEQNEVLQQKFIDVNLLFPIISHSFEIKLNELEKWNDKARIPNLGILFKDIATAFKVEISQLWFLLDITIALNEQIITRETFKNYLFVKYKGDAQSLSIGLKYFDKHPEDAVRLFAPQLILERKRK
jgi:hypothetical protein